MTTFFEFIKAIFSTDSDDTAKQLDNYLAEAQSISELEYLQRKWERRQQGSGLPGYGARH